jgi:hypothetical protein
MKVVYVYADNPKEWNCSEWNCIIPAKAINRTKNHTANTIHVNDFVKNTDTSQKICSEADVIVVERNYFGDCLTMMQFWKVRGKTVLAIFDDAYDIMHPQNISYPFWTFGEVKIKDAEGKDKTVKMNPRPLDQFKWGLRIVKGIQVPSENLAKDWSKYNKTYFVHNFLDIEKYLNIEPLLPHPSEELYVGWCGSLSHYSSFTDSGVLGALKKISKTYPQVTILISGDRRIYELLEVEKKIFQPFVPADKWTPLLKSLDIGLAPLSGEYDKRRSWIKGLEYLALKIPFVATNYITYDELHNYGGVMTENGYANWCESLSEMIENYSHYKNIAENEGFQFALSQSSDNNIEKVTLKLYEQLLNTPYEA